MPLMPDPRGTTIPSFSIIRVLGTLPVSTRGGDPTYSHTIDTVTDKQTTPAQNSIEQVAGPGVRTRIMARLWAVTGAACHAAIYQQHQITHVASRISPIFDFASTCPTIIDFGDVQADERNFAYIRMWSDDGSGVRCDLATGYIRAQVYDSVAYADPLCLNDSVVAAPAYGPPQNVVHELRLSPSLLDAWQPFVIDVPPPSTPEFINLAIVGGLEGLNDGSSDDVYAWRAMFNGASYPPSALLVFSQVVSCVHQRFESEPIDPLIVFGIINQDTLTVAGPGDVLGVQIQYHHTFAGTTYSFYASDVLTCYGIQALNVSCSANGLIVAYDGPMPAAIDHYEARIYYGSGLTGTDQALKEVIGPITDNPYHFAAQPPYTPVGTQDGDYEFAIRAYYRDGSWVQNGCPWTPTPSPVFRAHFKVHH